MPEEHASNPISAEENDEKIKLETEQLYYLPTEAFAGVRTLGVIGGVSSTSPPYLSINPAPMQTTYQKSTVNYDEGKLY